MSAAGRWLPLCHNGAAFRVDHRMPADTFLSAIRWNEQGLAPAIAQDAGSGRVLMVAWMNAEALQLTVSERRAVYWSRSRGALWHKGEESGNVQHVLDIRIDCDADVILLQVRQDGGIACHTGRESCFYRRLEGNEWQTVDAVRKDPAEMYGKHDE